MYRIAVLLCGALLLAPGVAHAQAQAGDVGIFFTAAPTTGADTWRTGVIAFAPFDDIFVVTFDVPGGMLAYEFSMQLPPGLLVSGGRILPPGATDFGAGDDNWIVGTGGVCHGAVGTFVLVRYAEPLFLAFPGLDLEICLAPASPSSFPEAVPGYSACPLAGEPRTFSPAYLGCARINPTSLPEPLPEPPHSFGALKTRF